MSKETTQENGRSSVPLDKIVMPSDSIKGRSEALRIILALEPEDGLDEYINSYPLADSGDYGAEWDVKKLKELFQIGNEYEESPIGKLAEAAEGYYWETVAKKDDMNTLKKLVSRLLGEIERGKINEGPHCTVEILKTWID